MSERTRRRLRRVRDDEPTVRPEWDEPVVRRALLRYVAYIGVTGVVLLLSAFAIGNQIAKERALDEAELRTEGIADSLVGPLVDRDVRAGRPGAIRPLVLLLEHRIDEGSIRHVKLWSEDGTILWTDETDLVGRRFDLPDDVAALFEERGVVAEVSDLRKEENVEERDEGRLLEVYAATRDADGEPLVFEAYLSTERLDADQRAVVLAILFVSSGVLLLFGMAVLPLGVSLARRIQRGREDRAQLLRHALLASDLERRRIAQDLHDGVIQDLAGIGYLLPTLRQRVVDGRATAADDASFSRISALLTRDVTALRSLLVDIYPADLENDGLAAAADELAQDAVEAGIRIDVSVQPDADLPVDTARLVYRVLREGLRNVVTHSGARTCSVDVRRSADEVHVAVTDDGRGLPPGAPDGTPADVPEGHFGLRLLRDTVTDLGGRLELDDVTGGGVRLRVTVPVILTGS